MIISIIGTFYAEMFFIIISKAQIQVNLSDSKINNSDCKFLTKIPLVTGHLEKANENKDHKVLENHKGKIPKQKFTGVTTKKSQHVTTAIRVKKLIELLL